MPSKLGSTIRRGRKKKGIGLRELARRIDKSPSLLSMLENADAPPPVSEETLRSIETELDLEPFALVVLSGKTPEEVTPSDALDVALYREVKNRSKKDRQELLERLRRERP